jgi:hypothetical protein
LHTALHNFLAIFSGSESESSGADGQFDVYFFAAALALCLIAFYLPFLTGTETFYRNDSGTFFEPFCAYIANAIAHGRWPLWNSLSYCGMPQIAVASPGLFYPPNLIFLVLPFSPALAVSQILHQLIGGIGMFLLVRSLRWGLPAAIVAGSGFALCGYNFASSHNYTLVTSSSWVPLCIYALHSLTESAHRRRNFILASLAFALMILGGRPEIWLFGSVLALGFVLWNAALTFKIKGKLGSDFLLQIAAFAAGTMLVSPTLLPLIEWSRLSPRAAGLAVSDVLSWSANWYDFLTLVLSQPLGDTGTPDCRYVPLIGESPGCINYITSAFVGPAIITLSIWGLFDKTWKGRGWLAGLWVLFALGCLGSNTPLAPWVVSKLTFLAMLRYPIKLMVFVQALLALFAARGIKAALNGNVGAGAVRAGFIFWLLFLMLFAIKAPELLGILAPPTARVTLIDPAAKALVPPGCIAFAVGAILNLCLFGFTERRITKPVFAFISLACVMTTLAANAFLHERCAAHNTFYQRPAVGISNDKRYSMLEQYRLLAAAEAPRLFFADIDLWSPSRDYLSQNHGRSEGYWKFQRDILKPNTNLDCGVPETFGFEASVTAAFRDLVYSTIEEEARTRTSSLAAHGDADLPLYRLCQLTATSLVATRAYEADDYGLRMGRFLTFEAKHFDLVREDPFLNLKLYRVKEPLPRIYFPEKWSSVSSVKEAKSKLFVFNESGNSPLAHSYVLAEGGEAVVNGDSGVGAGAATARIAPESTEERLSIIADVDSSRLLVLSDTAYPGWIATIDDRPVNIYRTNMFARGVFVPPGHHLIKFVYDPLSLKFGYLAVVIGTLLMCALCWQFRDRRPPA